MKLFEKVMAIALASVLALSVLTGCGKEANLTSAKLAEAMNDIATIQGTGLTYTADSDLDNKAAKVVSYVKDKFNGVDTKGKSFDKLVYGALDQNATKEIIALIGATEDVSKSGQLYKADVVEIGNMSNDNNKMVGIAGGLSSGMNLNSDGSAWWIYKKDVLVGFAVGTVGDHTFAVAISKGEAVVRNNSLQ